MLGRLSECTRWLMEGPATLDEVTLSIMTKAVNTGWTGGGRDSQERGSGPGR
jgi:hypothetical protein